MMTSGYCGKLKPRKENIAWLEVETRNFTLNMLARFQAQSACARFVRKVSIELFKDDCNRLVATLMRSMNA